MTTTWQPISFLPAVEEIVDSALCTAREDREFLSTAPSLSRKALLWWRDMTDGYSFEYDNLAQQADRWRHEPITPQQRHDLQRVCSKLDELGGVLGEIRNHLGRYRLD